MEFCQSEKVGTLMVALGGHAWLLRGLCVVALGGVRGCSGGCAWLLWGGMCGIRRDTEIRAMSGRYASYWNAFLCFMLILVKEVDRMTKTFTNYPTVHLTPFVHIG